MSKYKDIDDLIWILLKVELLLALFIAILALGGMIALLWKEVL